jgi:hypothetical protein
LSIPTLCSPLNSTQVEQALAAVNHRDLQGWELKNVQETQSKKKRTI